MHAKQSKAKMHCTIHDRSGNFFSIIPLLTQSDVSVAFSLAELVESKAMFVSVEEKSFNLRRNEGSLYRNVPCGEQTELYNIRATLAEWRAIVGKYIGKDVEEEGPLR
jgi:hypothetical protein